MKRLGKYLIDTNDYVKETELGRGSYGTVWRAIHKDTGDVVAMKELGKDKRINTKNFIREVVVPIRLPVPGVVRVLGFCLQQDDCPATIITEFMPNGTLKQAIENYLSKGPTDTFGPTEISKALFGIPATMKYMHGKDAMHRDLKPENVFMDDKFEIRIADFGLSRMIDQENLEHTMAIGSPLFMAPELLTDDEHYDNKVDVYAYAILIYRMFSNNICLEGSNKPPRSQQHLMMQVLRGSKLKRVPESPDNWWCLIEMCWNNAPEKRPTFAQIVDILSSNDDLIIEGTDMVKYKEYQTRITQPIEEDVENARMMESIAEILSTTKKGVGLTVIDEAAEGDSLCLGQCMTSMTKSKLLGMEDQAFRPFVFKRKASAFD